MKSSWCCFFPKPCMNLLVRAPNDNDFNFFSFFQTLAITSRGRHLFNVSFLFSPHGPIFPISPLLKSRWEKNRSRIKNYIILYNIHWKWRVYPHIGISTVHTSPDLLDEQLRSYPTKLYTKVDPIWVFFNNESKPFDRGSSLTW